MRSIRRPIRTRTILTLICFSWTLGATVRAAPERQPQPYDQGLRELARELSEALQEAKAAKLAIADFVDEAGTTSPLGTWLRTELTHRFARLADRPELFERQRLETVLEELELQGSGLLNPESAASIGRFSGVDAVLYGSYDSAEKTITVRARIALVETAKIRASASVLLDREGIPVRALTRPAPGSSEASTAAAGTPLASWQAGPIRVEVASFHRQFDRKRATLGLRFINRSSEVIFLAIEKENFGICSSGLKDEKGSAHRPLAGGRGSGIACVTKTAKRSDFTHLPPGPTPVSMTFKANEGDLIYGELFQLTLRLVQLRGEERVRYAAGFEDLRLPSRDTG